MAGHEIGTGAYTVVAIAVADRLGLRIEDVKVLMGDSDLPPVPGAGGSNNAASTTNVAAKACEEMRSRMAAAAAARANGSFAGVDPADLKLQGGALSGGRAARDPLEELVPRRRGRARGLRREHAQGPAAEARWPDSTRARRPCPAARAQGRRPPIAFGAHFIEVRVHVAPAKSGRRASSRPLPRGRSSIRWPPTASSWAARSGASRRPLHEATEIDPAARPTSTPTLPTIASR